jgi:hypothetical protein
MKLNVTLWFCFILQAAFCQTTGVIAPEYIPKSPEAAEFLKSGDYKVNMAKGTQAVSIPLYTLKAGSFELPISMNYAPSGIKVNQEATWVGLGWNLNFGAQITLDAQGGPDEINLAIDTPPTEEEIDQYFSDHPYCVASDPYINQLRQKSWIRDLYRFTSPTVNGTFVVNDYTEGIVNAIPPDAFKVEFIQPGRGFKITDIAGNIYVFDQTHETSKDISQPGSQNYISAWFVDKIITKQNNVIDFIYENDGTFATYTHDDSYTFSKTVSDGAYLCINNPFAHSEGPRLEVNRANLTTTFKIKEIRFKNERVLFTGAPGRCDMVAPSELSMAQYPTLVHAPNLLKFIEIEEFKNDVYHVKKAYEFNYGCFGEEQGGDYRSKRLKLVAIDDMIGDGSTKFSYSSIPLPGKDSKSVDFWGYYNGKPNLSYVPTQMVPFEPTEYSLAGENYLMIGNADRSVNPAYIQAGMLTKITYPTGGFTEFEYEPNTYLGQDLGNTVGVTKETVSYNAFTGTGEGLLNPFGFEGPGIDLIPQCNLPDPNNCVRYQTIDFTAENATAILSFNVSTNLSETDMHYRYARVRIFVGGAEFWSSEKIDTSTPITLSFDGLNSGTILLEAYSEHASINNFQLVYFNHPAETAPLPENCYGPGVRISGIRSFTEEGRIAQRKKYVYELTPGMSSGKLLLPIGNAYKPERQKTHQVFTCERNCPTPCNFQAWKTTTKNIYRGSSIFASANAVTYTKVRELVFDCNDPNSSCDQLTSGYTDYDFSFKPYESTNDGSIIIPYEWMNGEALSKRVYNKEHNVVLEEVNTYVDDPSKKSLIKGYKIFCSCDFAGGDPSDLPASGEVLVPAENSFYNHYIDWHYLIRTDTSETFYNGVSPVGSINKSLVYSYENPLHMQLTKVQTTSSDGESLETFYSYPQDDPTADEMDQLIARNRIAEKISTKNYKNGYFIGQRSLYRDWGNNVIEPFMIQSIKGGTVWLDRVEFGDYDAFCNPLQVQQVGGTPVSYIWAYDYTKLVAKIENKKYVDINPTLITDLQDASMSLDEPEFRLELNTLRQSPDFAGSMVSTFTYLPLIGVRSITDPKGISKTFSYDVEWRLNEIRDNENKILMRNEYRYRDQTP